MLGRIFSIMVFCETLRSKIFRGNFSVLTDMEIRRYSLKNTAQVTNFPRNSFFLSQAKFWSFSTSHADTSPILVFPMLRSIISVTIFHETFRENFNISTDYFTGMRTLRTRRKLQIRETRQEALCCRYFWNSTVSFFANSHATRLILNMYSSTKRSAHWSAGMIVAPWFHESKIVPFGRFEVQRTPNRVLLVPMIACPQ